MNAVQANDLRAMGQLWGTKSGPMVGRMDADQLDMRLTVMQRYLVHEKYQIVPARATATVAPAAAYRGQLKTTTFHMP